MRITERLREPAPFFSFEFFPPKTDEGVASLMQTAAALKSLNPAYVSVTYGAGGSTRARTVAVAKRIQGELGIDVLAHITCTGSSVDELRDVFRELEAANISNVLALRGDPPRGSSSYVAHAEGFAHASDLVRMVEHEFDFCIGAACYPEKHPEADSFHADLDAVEKKVRMGARFLITQLFFDNTHYFDFLARVRARGITVPVIPGIMPITNYEQIDRFTAMCGATIPAGLRSELELRRNEPEAVAELGVAFATLQCVELIEGGAPGIHFYTLNKSPATRAVVSALQASRFAARRTPLSQSA
jgi:methylenetetrahydrofolate reductase (NADPH)